MDNDLIGLNENLLCKTTGWQNNCGLNCLTHFLYSKLEKDELQTLFEHNAEYKALLETFREYYALPHSPTWDDIKQILASFETPADREAVFAPVLRKHLGKVMARKPVELWDTEGTSALSEYLTTGEINDVAGPIIMTNQDFFDKIKTQYERNLRHVTSQRITDEEKALAVEKIRLNNSGKGAVQVELTDENIKKQIEFARKIKLEDDMQQAAKTYWTNQGGCKNYVDYLGDVNNAVMISADQLSLLCKKLNIGAEIYTPDSIRTAKEDPALAVYTHGAQNLPEREFTWTIKVHNSGVHWEYEEPDRKLTLKKAHNYHYPSTFYESDPRLGKFKTFGAPEHSPVMQIIEHVKTWFSHKPKVESNQQGSPIPPLATKLKDLNANKAKNEQTKFDKLHRDSEKAMNVLLDKLEHALKNHKIDILEKQLIFEYYFKAFKNVFKTSDNLSTSPDENKIKTLLKEIQVGNISTFKTNAIEKDQDTKPSKKPRLN